MKNIVLSGVSGGMGLATAKLLTQEGYKVYGLDINEPSEVIENLVFIKTDLRDQESVQNAYNTIISECVNIDAIVHMAGIYDLNSLVEIDEARILRIFDINFFSIYRLNKAFVNLLVDGGKIIITSSELAPLDPLPFTGLYGITKSTVEKYAFSLRMELQLLNKKVIIIRPGAVETKLLDASARLIENFADSTKLYEYNAKYFLEITNKVENRKIPPLKIAQLCSRILKTKRPKYIYKINRNPFLIMLNCLPQSLQTKIIRGILTSKR